MSLPPTPSEQQKQFSLLRTKYENQIKKNNNLLKMNSNLMNENEIYQNCFVMLKKWGHSFFVNNKVGENGEDYQAGDDSCIDIQEQGQEFIRSLTSMIDTKVTDLTNLVSLQQRLESPSQRDMTQQSIPLLRTEHHQEQCSDCNRWKELYMKESKETLRLQKMIDESQLFVNQKQVNMVKLKNDFMNLLEDYWTLYRRQVGGGWKAEENDIRNSINIITEGNLFVGDNGNQKTTNRQTVRIRDSASNSGNRSKEKRSGSGGNGNSGSKSKKGNNTLGNSSSSGNNSKQISAFSKQKTVRNSPTTITDPTTTKYTIHLSPSNPITLFPSTPAQQSLLQSILTSFSQASKSFQQQNLLLKQQLKEFNSILSIYREKERSKLMLLVK